MIAGVEKPAVKSSTDKKPRRRVLLVTGMSGAGRSSTLKLLEDMGYEAVDNLPLSLLSDLVSLNDRDWHPIAIGIDIRTRDFGVSPFLLRIDRLVAAGDLDARVLFLDCEDEVLRRRFSETRRRHPLAAEGTVSDGIAGERRLLSELRDRADVVVDTSVLSLIELKRLLTGQFALDASPALAVFVVSFAYRHGLPREADLVLDVRFLANPHYRPDLRPLSGRDPAVGAFIEADPVFVSFRRTLEAMLESVVPGYQREGKSYLTIAVGCTGGRHRSVYVAECLKGWLGARGLHVDLAHRDIDRADRA
ncbi:MAG: RNase adapter RapZ [Rhodospirillaceae bacterium]|nr:RNase adapter RapZ [Rhodospirillaceae bacterium]